MHHPIRYFIIDAFTNRPFTGNPAAVVMLDQWKDDRWLQNVAMEMNLSETAFLVQNAYGYDLRWFTPTIEVDLCGHATLTSVLALARLGKILDGNEIGFSTRSGILRAKLSGSQVELDFPLTPNQPADPPNGLLESLKVSPIYVGKTRFDYLLEVDSEDVLRAITPDFKQLKSVKCRGVIVTARSQDSRYDFVSRFFAPAAGIDEDPVCGSAHCCLADFWKQRLNKPKMIGYQASARGGVVGVEVRGDRVILSGEGVIVAEGQFVAD